MPYAPYSTIGRLALHQYLESRWDNGSGRVRMTGEEVAEAVRVDSLRSEARSVRMLNSRGFDAMTACPCLAEAMIEKSRVTTGLEIWRLPTWMPDRI